MPLGNRQMQQLFDHDVQAKIKLAKRKVGNFDKLPTATQNAIVDGFFRGDLSGSPKTLKLMNSGDFKAAAVEYLNNNEYRESKRERTGVAPRMDRNAAAFRSGHFLKRKNHPTIKKPLEGEGIIRGEDGKQYYRLRKVRS